MTTAEEVFTMAIHLMDQQNDATGAAAGRGARRGALGGSVSQRPDWRYFPCKFGDRPI